VRNFAAETNLTVITEDGGFFTFDVHYAENPVVSTLNLTVQEPQTEGVQKPAVAGDYQPTAPASEGRVLLREVGREKPATVKRMLSDIYRQNRTDVKGIRAKKYGIEVEVLGIYVFNDVIYIHTCISNDTNISFEVDARRFIVADRKLAKRYGTAADAARSPARMQRSGSREGTPASADGIRTAQTDDL
jgi:Bac_Flav_CT_N: Bacteroides conjugative transposon TraN protein